MGFLACVWDVVGQIVVSVFDLLPSSTCSDVRLGDYIVGVLCASVELAILVLYWSGFCD